MNWMIWLKGLAAVAIGGAATGATAAIGNGQVNVKTAITAGIGALSTVLAYLIQSPLPAPPATALSPVGAGQASASQEPAASSPAESK